MSTAPEAQPVGRGGMPANFPGYLTEEDPIERAVVLARWDEYAIGYGLSKPDRLKVTAEMTRLGRSAREIARTLGTAEITVVRYRRQAEEKRS